MKSKLNISIWIITFIPLVAYLIFYNILGDTIPVDWDGFGDPDTYVVKTIGLFMVPLVSVFMSLILYFRQKIRKKDTIFSVSYDIYRLFISILFAVGTMFPLYLISFGGGNTYNVLSGSLLLVSILVLIAGFIFPSFKPESDYGFHTPWTKASTNVFLKTQQTASTVFILGAIPLGITTIFIQKYTLLATLVYTLIMLIMILIPILYSKKVYENE